MPFIDLDNGLPQPIDHSFDFVVIGAGVAGIMISLKLAEKGLKVLLLESGHFAEDEKKQKLNEVIQTGKELSSSVWGRKRVIGGTSIAWGGQSLPFSSLDFESRDWVEHSGWPIGLDDLGKYYPEANKFMYVDELNYDSDIFELLRMDRLPFDVHKINYHFSKWSPKPNFQNNFKKNINETITLIYNALVTKIHTNADGLATSLAVKNSKNTEFSIPVKKLILTAGAIETTRLLLVSRNEIHSMGIGNHSGWLGKCFMEHPCVEVGVVKTKEHYKLQKHFNTHISRGRKYSIRLSLSDFAQKEHKLLNGSAGIMFYYPDDQFDPYIEIRKILRQKKLKSLNLNMLNNFKALFRSLKALIKDKLIYKEGAQAKLVMMLEQEPLPSSSIGLSAEKDEFGMAKVVVNWEIGHNTWKTVCYLADTIVQELDRLSIGTLQKHEHIELNNPNWKSYLTDVNHHMGGTRMSATVNEGVVDSNLKVWGHDNIYICSCSVYPTTSHSNPTLTMMALGLRLVHQLSN
jgi:choline dehydrogenase-like flavoprotein